MSSAGWLLRSPLLIAGFLVGSGLENEALWAGLIQVGCGAGIVYITWRRT